MAARARLLSARIASAGIASASAYWWFTQQPALARSTAKASGASSSSTPGVELLVHNISHSDMVLTLQEVPQDGSKVLPVDEAPTFLARPVFNSFNPVSQAIVGQLGALDAAGSTPKVVTSMSKYRVQYATGLDLTNGIDDLVMLPSLTSDVEVGGDSTSSSGADSVGGSNSSEQHPLHTQPRHPPPRLRSHSTSQPHSAWGNFHVKGRRQKESGAPLPLDPLHSGVRVVAVYLPLLAVVLPEWMRAMKRRALQRPANMPEPRKVLVIVSGAGQPRDDKANPADNSTEGTGRIIERFIQLVHPDIEIVHIPSAYGIFRYDDNVRFVKEQVLPIIEAKRAEVVTSHGDQWPSNLKVTVCLADGAPARISAINAAMRSYRPDYLHVWRTKTCARAPRPSAPPAHLHTAARPLTHLAVAFSRTRPVARSAASGTRRCSLRRTSSRTRSRSSRCARPPTARSSPRMRSVAWSRR